MLHAIRSLLLAVALLGGAGAAQAAEVKPFERAAFEAAQAADKPILVEVKAWWCPVCASQAASIHAVIKDTGFAQLVVFQLNYDRQKVELPRFDVHKQGTLLAYHGARQVGRLDFVTDRTAIRNLLSSAVR